MMPQMKESGESSTHLILRGRATHVGDQFGMDLRAGGHEIAINGTYEPSQKDWISKSLWWQD
jgi:hypothetical protein